MKRYFLIVFIFVINSIILSSCAFLQQSNNSVCVSCIDSDNDTKCDVCQKYVPPKAEEHTACSDSDSDGKCDVCGKEISENIHSNCTDSDSDGKCDECGKSILEDTHTECTDSDGDGKCDECSEPIPDTPLLTLIEDGEIKFSLVTADGLSGNVHMELDSLSEKLARFGYSLEKYSDKSDNAADKIEVLVGTVNSRGEKYRIDGWDYGFRGYAVKVIDSKVIIVAGNEVALNSAIRYFSEEVLGLTEDTEKLRDAVFFKSKETEYYQE